jgi:hypothetical protein
MTAIDLTYPHAPERGHELKDYIRAPCRAGSRKFGSRGVEVVRSHWRDIDALDVLVNNAGRASVGMKRNPRVGSFLEDLLEEDRRLEDVTDTAIWTTPPSLAGRRCAGISMPQAASFPPAPGAHRVRPATRTIRDRRGFRRHDARRRRGTQLRVFGP